jgi:hypothetical protein
MGTSCMSEGSVWGERFHSQCYSEKIRGRKQLRGNTVKKKKKKKSNTGKEQLSQRSNTGQEAVKEEEIQSNSLDK